MPEQEKKPKYKIGNKVAVKVAQKRAFQIGTVIQIGTTQPGQLGRAPGTILYLIRVEQFIDENRQITYFNKPPLPVTTATEQEMQVVRKTTKN